MDKYIKYDAQPGVVLYIENKGNNRECCYDLDIKDDVTELYLMVFDFCLDDNKKQFRNVSKIVILDTCGDLCLPNQMFPNVKEVISCNNHYAVKQNKLLINNSVKQNELLLNNFSRSLINVFGWNASDAIDMRGIEVIEDRAFWGCQSRVLENCDTDYIKCEEHAFDGSYFSEQPFNNGVKMAGCIVIALDKTADNVVIPEETRCMAHGLDFSQIKKMTLKTSKFCCDYYDGNLPETLIIDGCNDIDSGEIKDITGYGVKHIEVVNNKNFVTLDDIVYNKTKTTVVACLAEKTGMVELPEGVTKIEREAFMYCEINSVKFPSTLRLISDNAFAGCENLKTIDFGCGLTHVGSSASWYTFSESGLERVNFPKQVKSIGRGAFYGSQLKEVTLNEGLEAIEEDSFMMCLGLESISIPKTVSTIGRCALSYVKNVYAEHFTEDMLTAIILPPAVRSSQSFTVLTIDAREDVGICKTFYVPKHLKHKHINTVKCAIFDFLAGKNDITNRFYMYSSSMDEKQDTALAIYKDCKDEQAKEYVKKYAVSMLERYIETERYDDFIDFINLDILSSARLKSILQITEDAPVLAACVLDKLKTKDNSRKFVI